MNGQMQPLMSLSTPWQGASLGELDFLGRMPLPLRRHFKGGLDGVVTGVRQGGGPALNCAFLAGGQWYGLFDRLAEARRPEELPAMLVSPWGPDVLKPDLLAHYAPRSGAPGRLPPQHPACLAAGLPDPQGVFRLFALVPQLFLVDKQKLGGRPVPRVWADLLEPCYEDAIVFGGWRPRDQGPYRDFNTYLLLFLAQAFGFDALDAFGGNVKHLLHNIRSAKRVGSTSEETGAITIMPWLQAELCPHRQRAQVVWPEDGALAMPMGYLLQPGQESRLAPICDYLTGAALGRELGRNCYPATAAAHAALPQGARLRWPGWDFVRSHDLAAYGKAAGERFFRAWWRRQEGGSLAEDIPSSRATGGKAGPIPALPPRTRQSLEVQPCVL